MERFVVRKNTLPYIHQWAVIDIKTGNKIGEYKTEKNAKHACEIFKKYGLPNDIPDIPLSPRTALDAIDKRMRRQKEDQLPKPPKYSDKRRIELD